MVTTGFRGREEKNPVVTTPGSDAEDTMLNTIRKFVSATCLIFVSIGFAVPLAAQSPGNPQTSFVSLLGFAPQSSGFGFKNYGNDKHFWQDDLGAEDLIRLVGAQATCLSGTTAKNCVMDASPRKWLEEQLKAIDKGRCTGMAVACLRFNQGRGFKGKNSLSSFQPGVRSPFGLRLDPSLENYFAYYWLTQVFDEVSQPKIETAKKGPLEIVKMLTAALESKSDLYTMSIYKYEKGRVFDGHEFNPFAVEDMGTRYRISIYDNNYPGATRYLYVNKGGTQAWSYSSANVQNAKPDYVGDINTQTLSITANSWRDGKCFDPPFGRDAGKADGCGSQTVSMVNAAYRGDSFSNPFQTTDDDGEDAEFFLTGDGDMLVTDGGRRIGYDSKTNRSYNESKDAISDLIVGGLGFDLPHFTFPYREQGDPYKIVFSGKYLTSESVMDFVFSGPGFTVGFNEIRLDPRETLTAEISRDGEAITFTASSDGQTPEVFYAFDADDDANASYITTIGGVALDAGKALTYEFDIATGKLFFSDDDGNEDAYDIDLIRINANGTEQIFQQDDLDIGKADRYEMDFGNWDGKGNMCFKDDDDGDGFDDEECEQPPE